VERAVRAAVDGLCAMLARRGRGVRALEVRVARAGLAPVRGTVHLGAPTRDAAHLWSVLRPRVERVHLGCHEDGQGVECIALRAVRLGRMGEGTDDEREAGTQRALGELVDHLSARLGDGCVRRP
jgi:nucleotidyltransferase/DNA polymerase involved in DNA repair